MLLVIGAVVGLNLSLRVVLGELREHRLRGGSGARGDSRLRPGEYLTIARRGLLFLAIPMAIGFLLDLGLGTTIPELAPG